MIRRNTHKTNFLTETMPIINKGIKWAKITGYVNAVLKPGYTNEELEEFKSLLDFDYDAGYGVQEINGTIVMNDNSWYTRDEYDGSEWWAYHKCPEFKE